ncbi:uncharacterized protein KY384_005805 [Bacidia gigantensis]|uniref:uncharacterized protein n=1 Tax=Bacidia gigantensis TaxID=2732470 RepID=UPI001D04928B|nr:uncharacterized protein KY384_005805 [Bacidia gigantensis]KAG8529170.1 hypothetical protein KY384_005805 [Bacidia gigantensis]
MEAEVEVRLLPIDFLKDTPLECSYEALSWCWGTSKPTGRIIIREARKGRKDDIRLEKKVTPDLVAALKALRHQKTDRFLWIDQICIDQDNPLEKNHQVEVMSDIYGRARKVCIWLGEGDRSSRMALKFIQNEVLQLQNFDELCESEKASEKWSALLDLMQRPWFSRRWVVQEIALAHRTVVYCGSDKILWKKFAVAVELFVEVETATHRLSEVMKKDRRFYHVPGWFEYVSALGASLLVEATGKLFRNYKPNGPMESEDDSESEDDPDAEDTDEEEEVASEADAGSDETAVERSVDRKILKGRSPGQPLLTLEYLVSSLSIFEVTTPHDAVYALLAIARDTTPFADDKGGFHRQLTSTQEVFEAFTQKKRYKVDYKQPFADTCKDFVAFCIEESKDSSRALDIICRPWAPDVASHDTKQKGRHKRKVHRNHGRSQSRFSEYSESNTTSTADNIGDAEPTWPHMNQQISEDVDQDIPLPSWIPSLSGAAYAMYSQAGVHTLKMGRKNADTLVGLPPSNQSLERNYNAAETRGIERKSLRFVKRPATGHWSMYVKGFVLDKAYEIQPSSQGGAIPYSWAIAGGWSEVPDSDPPDAFWRTLVADRGRDGRNPPVYYSRACKESFLKGGLSSGSVNMTDLINNERFGLTGQSVERNDLICILYGCSVPVALRRLRKNKEDVIAEMQDDLLILHRRICAKYRKVRDGRAYRRQIANLDRALNYFWEGEMKKRWYEDPDGRKAWLKTRKAQKRSIRHVCGNLYNLLHEPDEENEVLLASTNLENIEQLLERRAYVQWKAQKRKSGELPVKWFRRGDKRTFALRLKWGRVWKLNVQKQKAKRKALEGMSTPKNIYQRATSFLGESFLSVLNPRQILDLVSLLRSKVLGFTPAEDYTNPQSSPTRHRQDGLTKLREKDDSYILRHKKRYLEPYEGRVDDDGKVVLSEPDWDSTEKDSLHLQEKWCYYKFLGECYIHGMMDGEAMAHQNENGIPAQVFELR